jgi:hypothetical protein
MIHRKAALFAICAALALPLAAVAQATSPITPLMLQQWRLGQDLGRYGMAQNDAQALITAARLLRASRLQASTARFDRKPGEEPLSADVLLQRAQALARDQQHLAPLIEDALAARRGRGTLIGPQVQPMLMPARDSKPIVLSYKPGQKAFFGITGEQTEDVAFSVRGPRGELLCEPRPAGPDLLCEWVSGETAEVRVVVTNRSPTAVMLTFFHD